MKISQMNLLITCLVIVLSFFTQAPAECTKDSIGKILCSRVAAGSAVRDNVGNVVCGKGQCRLDNIGKVMCSKIEAGGAEKDDIGNVLCLGGCEPASEKMCVPAQR